jgi:limonene 1,2-monooxygenase
VLHSYELVARYVMPHFQGSIKSLERSQAWSAAKRPELLAQRDAALARARQDYADTRPS